jgi:hypothetical protein
MNNLIMLGVASEETTGTTRTVTILFDGRIDPQGSLYYSYPPV